VDVGCGIGGSSRYFAKKYGAKCSGITLSPVQAERGNALAAAEGLSDMVLTKLHFERKINGLRSIQIALFFCTYFDNTIHLDFRPSCVTEQVSLQVADALEQPFPDGQFDLVWSMESGEHMPDKRKVSFIISPDLSSMALQNISRLYYQVV
jgi:tocopherol O-methyltransferase